MAGKNSTVVNALPEDCLAHVLSLTSPKDASRVSLVSSTFRDASNTDTVWERFLPTDYREIIARSVVGDVLKRFQSKKELFLHLCRHPILIDDGLMRFFLDKATGKKCFNLSARYIFSGSDEHPEPWRFLPSSTSSSRFPEIAEIVQYFQSSRFAKIDLNMLSPSTNYAAHLIYNSSANEIGFIPPDTGHVRIKDGGSCERRVFWLDPDEHRSHSRVADLDCVDNYYLGYKVSISRKRVDGWMEVELGDCFVGDGDVGYLEVKLGDNMKRVLIQGIEIRPKS